MKNKFLSILVLALAFSFHSCKNTSSHRVELTEENSIKVKDANGEVRVPTSPKRVVLFDLGALDVFDELGIADNVVGFPKHSVPKYLNKFKENDSLINMGSLIEPNFQKINEANPDLIIIGERQRNDYKEFDKIAPTIIYDLDYSDYVNSISRNLLRIGEIYGLEDEAKAIEEDLLTTIDSNKAVSDSLKGLIVMHNNGKFSAFGKGSRFGVIHDYLNVAAVSEDLEASTHGNSISSEYIQEKNPDILFVIDRNAAIGEGEIHRSTIENKLIKQTNAYKNNKIIYLTPDVWYLAGGGVQSMKIMADEVGKSL